MARLERFQNSYQTKNNNTFERTVIMSCFFYFLGFDLHGSTVKRKTRKYTKIIRVLFNLVTHFNLNLTVYVTVLQTQKKNISAFI